ncbi:MAG TPA: hypothetical protein VHE83_18330 [Mycobacteriales bacterium]|nr:hypothetical protein [Mycobacteriales bacterium]
MPARPALALLVLTAACGAGAPPVTGRVPATPSAAPPPLSPPPPSPSAPAPDSAVAAARAYLAAYDAAADSGDTTAYDRIVAPGCRCREPFLTDFVGALRTHHWHTDAHRSVTAVHVVRRAGSGAVVDVTFHVDAYRVLDADDRTVMAGHPDHATLRISLVRTDGRWVVADAVRR